MKKKKSNGSVFRNIIKYKQNSILIRNFGMVVVAMILPLLIVVFLVRTSIHEIVQKEISEANSNSLATTAKTIDSIIDKMFSFSYYLTENQEFSLLYMSEPEIVVEEYLDIYEKQVRFNMLVEEYIDSIYVYLEPQEVVLYDEKTYSNKTIAAVYKDEMKDLSWVKYYEDYHSERNFILCSRMKADFYPYLISMIRPVRIGKDSVRGAIIVNVDMRKLSRYLGYEDESGLRFYMVGSEGELYYSNQEELIESNSIEPQYLDFAWEEDAELQNREIDGITYVVSITDSEKYECRYVLCTPATYYENRLDDVNVFIRNIIIFTLFLGVVVAYIVTVHSFEPIQRIMNEISGRNTENEAEEDERVLAEEQDYENELQYITGMVRRARIRSNRIQMETENWMKKLNNAQMVALQNQINPHYLYNTLETINCEVIKKIGCNNSISDMISTLAQFFRIGLQRSGYLIRISEEIEHARLYVRILEKRYEGTIHVHWDIDGDILACKTVRLTLQPLIENAINHGLRPKRYEGTIIVQGGSMDNIIYLAVEDDGVGMKEEDCVAMNNELLNHYETDSEHVGIRNVNQRMKILFGDEYGINMVKSVNGGLKVRMILPKIE